MAQQVTDSLRTSLRALGPQDTLDVLRDAAQDLPTQEQQKLAQTLLFGFEPGQKVKDILYLMVIGALLVILLGAAAVVTGIVTTGANVDKVLGVFTTVLSFIIGLFVPSPAGRRG